MSDPFIAEIRMFGTNFAPRGYAYCNGQLLPIAQNTALFSIIGTVYGGDGRTTMGLPNLQGRAPVHPGRGPGLSARRVGERGGEESVALQVQTMGAHTHEAKGTSDIANTNSPNGTVMARPPGRGLNLYNTTNTGPFEALSSEGGGQPHNNMQPYLSIGFCIALTGVYPSRS